MRKKNATPTPVPVPVPVPKTHPAVEAARRLYGTRAATYLYEEIKDREDAETVTLEELGQENA